VIGALPRGLGRGFGPFSKRETIVLPHDDYVTIEERSRNGRADRESETPPEVAGLADWAAAKAGERYFDVVLFFATSLVASDAVGAGADDFAVSVAGVVVEPA
jgi:hypothetical protein